MKSLPINPRPFADEWLGSWLIRLAQANTMPLLDVIYFLGIDVSTTPIDRNDIDDLAETTYQPRRSLDRLLDKSFLPLHYTSYKRFEYDISSQVFDAQRIQICPVCLFEDPIPYLHDDWMCRSSFICKKHNIRLVSHCQKCKQVLGVFHDFGGLRHILASDQHLIVRCANCGYDLRDSLKRPSESNHIQYIDFTHTIKGTQLDFKMGLYLLVEKYKLETLLDPKNLQLIKNMPQLVAGSINDVARVARIHDFLDKLMCTLAPIHRTRVETGMLFKLGDACLKLANTASLPHHHLTVRLRWIGTLLKRESAEQIATRLAGALLVLTSDDAPWMKFNKHIHLDLDDEQQEIIALYLFGRGGNYEKVILTKFLRFLSLVARIPARSSAMLRLTGRTYRGMNRLWIEENTAPKVLADLYLLYRIRESSNSGINELSIECSRNKNMKILLHSIGTLELLRNQNYGIFRIIIFHSAIYAQIQFY